MKSSTKDEMRGKFHEVKGNLKKKAGQMVNSPRLEAEGQIEKFAGKVQQKAGRLEKGLEKEGDAPNGAYLLMTNKKCGDVMTRDLTCCLAVDTAQAAAQSMKLEDIGAVLVVDSQETKKLVGIVTDRDLTLKVVAEGLDPRQTRVETVMARDMVMCAPEDDLQRALDAMSKHQLRRIPVVDDKGRLAGIIAQADLATRLKQPEATGKVVERISRSKRAA